MRQIAKHRLLAGAVAAAVWTAFNFSFALYRYNRPRAAALTAAARAYDFYNGGRHSIALFIVDLLYSLFYVALVIVPYELTMRALQSGRLSGED